MKHYGPNRCEPSIEFQGGGGDQGRCEWRSEVFVKIQKKNKKNCVCVCVCVGGGGGRVGWGAC